MIARSGGIDYQDLGACRSANTETIILLYPLTVLASGETSYLLAGVGFG